MIVFIAGKDPLLEIGGGHSSYVRVHGRAAVHAGLTPHVFCASFENGIVETDFGVVHRIQSLWPFPRHRNPLGFRGYLPLVVVHAPQIAADVERFLLRHPGPHLIHSFGVWGCAGVTASKRLCRRGVDATPILNSYTTVVHESAARLRGMHATHGRVERAAVLAEHLWKTLLIDRYERRAHMGSRLVIVNYESVRRLLLARWPIAAKCRRLPYTSESAFLHMHTTRCAEVPTAIARLQPASSPLIVAVSRHDPRKGVDILLRALARVRAAGGRFRACLVGGGPLLDAHRRVAKELGLESCVAIEGFVADPDRYLQCADVFVLPSLQEGSGSLSLIEALQAGLPVVASNCDGIPEDVVDGDSALLVPPGDVNDLAESLARVLNDADLRRRLSRRARETFETRFSPDGFAAALRALYAEFGFRPVGEMGECSRNPTAPVRDVLSSVLPMWH